MMGHSSRDTEHTSLLSVPCFLKGAASLYRFSSQKKVSFGLLHKRKDEEQCGVERMQSNISAIF